MIEYRPHGDAGPDPIRIDIDTFRAFQLILDNIETLEVDKVEVELNRLLGVMRSQEVYNVDQYEAEVRQIVVGLRG